MHNRIQWQVIAQPIYWDTAKSSGWFQQHASLLQPLHVADRLSSGGFRWNSAFCWILLHLVFKGKSYQVFVVVSFCCFDFTFAVPAYSGIWLYLSVLNADLSTHRAQANQQIAVTRYSSISLAMEKAKKKGRWESWGMDTDLQLEVKRNHGDETCFCKLTSWIGIFFIPSRRLWEDERNRRGESLLGTSLRTL